MSVNNVMPRPEAALKRAAEHEANGQPLEAIETLHSLISHRRLRTVGWDEHVESVMLKLVKLCVKHKKVKVVREALYSYRLVTYQTNANALVKAVEELRRRAEQQLAAVKEKNRSERQEAGLPDDLEASESPEVLMLSSLQPEICDPHAKALHNALLLCWECLKVIMDLLRYAPKIDAVYHTTAQRAMDFCAENKRPQEFRRLCDMLRLHYSTCQKQRARQAEFEAFLRPETHLATRLKQLSVAASLCLWSQCFQTAEDILALGLHELVARVLRDRRCSLHRHRDVLLQQLGVYYASLADIFRVSQQPVFHAGAVLNLLLHTRHHKKITDDSERVSLCNRCTLAVLCAGRLAPQQEPEYRKKLATMLARSTVPTQEQMLMAVESLEVVSGASPEVRALHRLLTAPDSSVDPTILCHEARKHIDSLDEASKEYADDLRCAIFEKLLRRLSTVYSSLWLDFLRNRLCPEEFLPWQRAEQVIIEFGAAKEVPISLDYARGALVFTASKTGSEAVLSSRLATIAQTLASAVPRLPVARARDSVAATRDAFYVDLPNKLSAEATRLAARREEVRCRKTQQEREEEVREKQRVAAEVKRRQVEEAEEQQRRDNAMRRQADLRRKEKIRQMKFEVSQLILAELRSVASRTNTRLTLKGRALETLTAEEIANGTITHADYEAAMEESRQKERQERTRLRKAENKRCEHLVRALRVAEKPLLVEWKKERTVADEVLLNELRARSRSERAAAREAANKLRADLAAVEEYKKNWVERQLVVRQEQWKERCEERKKGLRSALIQEKIKRAQLRMEEEEKHRREEDERVQREAEERAVREAEEARLAEEEETRRKEAEFKANREKQAAIQRQKDQEIERKLRESGGAASASSGPVRAPARGDDVDFRRREDPPPPRSTTVAPTPAAAVSSSATAAADGPGGWRPAPSHNRQPRDLRDGSNEQPRESARGDARDFRDFRDARDREPRPRDITRDGARVPRDRETTRDVNPRTAAPRDAPPRTSRWQADRGSTREPDDFNWRKK